MSYMSKLIITFLLLSSCAPLHRNEESQFAGILKSNADVLLLQTCSLDSSNDVKSNITIHAEYSKLGNLYRVIRGDKDKGLAVVVTARGVTAYEFGFNEITGINSAKAAMESIREIYRLAQKYKNVSKIADKIVENNKAREKPRSLKFQETTVVNIALGFSEKLGALEESFFWQGVLPQILKTEDGKLEIPHEDDEIVDLKTPFQQRFFSESGFESEDLRVEWYEPDFFAKNVTWTYKSDRGTLTRVLDCTAPIQNSDKSSLLSHRQRFSRVNEVMQNKIVGSNMDSGSVDDMISLTLENFSKLSGMSLVDPSDYDWTEENYKAASSQFLKGSMVGLCLRYHNLLETQVRARICEDKELKFIFSSPQTKRSFVRNLGINLKLMVDGYGLAESLSESYKTHKKDITDQYLQYREEICISPIEPIFMALDSLKCDSI